MYKNPVIDLVQPQQLQQYIKTCKDELKLFKNMKLVELRTILALEKQAYWVFYSKSIRFWRIKKLIGKYRNLKESMVAKRCAISLIKKTIKESKTRRKILHQSLEIVKDDLILAKKHEKFYNELQLLGNADELIDYLSLVENPPRLLPFCDIHDHERYINSTFQFVENKYVEFYPRERLRAIKNIIQDSPNTNGSKLNFILHGTIGSGKSYILMALACYYILKGKRILYFNTEIPTETTKYWRSKLVFLLYQESMKKVDDRDKDFISNLEVVIASTQDHTQLKTLFKKLDCISPSLMILVDQRFEINSQFNYFSNFSHNMNLLRGVIIYSTRLGYERLTYYGNENSIFITVFSGLNRKEYNAWINSKFPNLSIFDENKVKKGQKMLEGVREGWAKIRYFTGAVPSLLKLLENMTLQSATLSINDLISLIETLRLYNEVRSMFFNIKRFCTWAAKRKDHWLYKKYAGDCVRNLPLPITASKYINHDYFYVAVNEYGVGNEYMGSACCGYARKYLYECMSQIVEIDLQVDCKFLQGGKLHAAVDHYIEELEREKIKSLGIFNFRIKSVIPVCNPSQITLNTDEVSKNNRYSIYDPEENSCDISEYNNLFIRELEELDHGEDDDDDDDEKKINEIDRLLDIETNIAKKKEEITNCRKHIEFLKYNRNIYGLLEKEAIYYKTSKLNFPSIDGILIAEKRIYGFKFVGHGRYDDPCDDFVKILEAIPNLNCKDGTHEIEFYWIITVDNQKGELLKEGTFKTNDNGYFKVRSWSIGDFDGRVEKVLLAKEKILKERRKMDDVDDEASNMNGIYFRKRTIPLSDRSTLPKRNGNSRLSISTM